MKQVNLNLQSVVDFCTNIQMPKVLRIVGYFCSKPCFTGDCVNVCVAACAIFKYRALQYSRFETKSVTQNITKAH